MRHEITDKAVAYIKANSEGKDPFFLYVPFINPHHPVIAHPDFKGKSGGGTYSDVLMEIDHYTGRVMDAIKEAGIDENTIVVWLSDNGPTRYSLLPYENGQTAVSTPTRGQRTSDCSGRLRRAAAEPDRSVNETNQPRNRSTKGVNSSSSVIL